jgi:hypothetical protein
MDALTASADRYFRAYARHCLHPDEDTLFAMLNALHSFNDKLDRSKTGNLYGSAEFLALKSLRNLFHHETELLHEVRIIPAQDMPPISVELLTVCLVDRSLVERALKREKGAQKERIVGALRWYGSVADIQPCVFNGAVDVYEMCRMCGLRPSSEAYLQLDDSYQREERARH